MGLSSESSCKFLGDAQPDLAQGHCPPAPHTEALLPPHAATKPRAALAHSIDGGPQGNEIPLSHSTPRTQLTLHFSHPFTVGDTLERWSSFAAPLIYFFDFKCHVYPGRACYCIRCTDFPRTTECCELRGL